MERVPRLLFLCLLGVSGCVCLEITRLSVPSFVQNGSEESVVLDCEYSYSPKEDKKLVVKWFHEDDPNPVYQWIPELDSRLFSDKFRLDEDYVLPAGDEYTRSRAIHIRRPTTELSGTYKCEVQSLEGSDVEEDSMTVYALPTSVYLNYTISSRGVVRVVCEVEGVFPLPSLALFQIRPKTVDSEPLNDTSLEYEEREDGAYDVEFITEIDEDELPSPTEGPTFFGCTVWMEGAGYEKEVKVPYFPNPIAEKQEGEDSENKAAAITSLVGYTSLLVYIIGTLFLLT